MTIFLELAKIAITSRILMYRDGSIKREDKPLNRVGGWFGLGYNSQLSEAKRNLADKLIADIRGLNNLATDKDTLDQLSEMLLNGKDDGKKASRKAHKKSEGTFGPLLERIDSSVRNLYRRLRTIEMLDIPKDNDPFKIFQFYMACYLSEKIAEEYQSRGLLKEFMDLPQITNSADLADYKNELVLLGLKKCQEIVPTMVNSARLFSQRREAVLTVIENMRAKNKEACKSLGPKVPLPVSMLPSPVAFLNVGGLDATFSFDPGDLEKCLEMAEKEIRECKYIPGQIIVDPHESDCDNEEGETIEEQREGEEETHEESCTL